MRKFLLILFIGFFTTATTFAQGGKSITGKLLDSKTNEPLIGATVGIKGTTTATTASLDGTFKITVPGSASALTITYIGYVSKDVSITGNNLGTIYLDAVSSSLSEVVVTGNVAIDRKTPVAVYAVGAQTIEEKMGTQEFPEILKSAPGVMVTKQGGGFGDSRLSIRGFKQANVAVLINGIPINDMENGAVFWSNWAGLSDVTSSMQAQRGLGASKVAVPSLGGTVNVTTRTTDAIKGGAIAQTLGSDGYQKTALSLSTGLNEKGWAFSIAAARAQGNGNADGLNFLGYDYFVNISKILSKRQTISMTLMGASQTHGQRTTKGNIADYRLAPQGIRYNQDWGYRNGQVFNAKNNYYSKPILSINHNWQINETSSLSTVLYASLGTGAGGSLQTGFNYSTLPKKGDKYAPIDFDAVTTANATSVDGSSANFFKSAHNDHKWYGILSTYKTSLTPNIDVLAGADVRYYEGSHFTEVTDLLGGQYALDLYKPSSSSSTTGDANNPTNRARKGDKIYYNYKSNVLWEGAYVQAEYTKDKLSAFVSASGSNTSDRRLDYFNYLTTDPKRQTAYKGFLGYQAKGGSNYNIDDHNNVFANIGYLVKAPFFGSVYLNNQNTLNPAAVTEKLFSYELGYGYRSSIFSANVNLYRTTYKDRAFQKTATVGSATYFANLTGVDELHQGVEFDFKLRPVKEVTLSGSLSVGDWKYLNSVGPIQVYDDAGTAVGSPTTYNLKGLKVGDQAQTSGALALDVQVLPDVKLGGSYNYYANYYADFNFSAVTTSTAINTWKVPNYGLVDIYGVFKFKFAGLDASLISNINNLLNTKYVSDAFDPTNSGLASSSTVFYGIGRVYSTTLKIKF